MLAGVAVRDERQRRDGGGERLAAHHQIHGRADRGTIGGDIAHGDRAVDAGSEAARGDDAERVAEQRQDLGALARRRAAVRLDADAAALGAVGQLVLDALGAGEAALAAAALLHRPDEIGLDRARRLVDVVAIEAEARLQAQRVARAEPDRLARLRSQQQLGAAPAPCRRRRRSRSRPRRCSRSGRCGSRTPPMRPLDGRHERGQPRRRDSLRHHGLGGRSLQGDERALRRRQQDHAGGQARWRYGRSPPPCARR